MQPKVLFLTDNSLPADTPTCYVSHFHSPAPCWSPPPGSSTSATPKGAPGSATNLRGNSSAASLVSSGASPGLVRGPSFHINAATGAVLPPTPEQVCGLSVYWCERMCLQRLFMFEPLVTQNVYIALNPYCGCVYVLLVWIPFVTRNAI